MTIEKLDQLNEKFLPIFQECLDNPTIDMDECGCWLEEDQDPDDHDCPYADYETTPQEVEAFDSAVYWLHHEEGLSDEETAEFVNSRGKKALNFFNFNIHYTAHGKCFLVSWEEMPALVLPPLTEEPSNSRAKGKEENVPMGAATSLLWRLLPKHHRELVIGDLTEEHAYARASMGATRARLWLWGQMVSTLVRCLWDTHIGPTLQPLLVKMAFGALMRWLLDLWMDQRQR